MFESLCGAPCARCITRCRLSTAHQDAFQVLEREGPVAFLVIDHVVDVLVRPFLQRPRSRGRSPWVLSVSVAERVACARVCTDALATACVFGTYAALARCAWSSAPFIL